MPKVSQLFKMCTDGNAFREFGNNNCINTDSSVALKLTFERKLNFYLLHRSLTLEERHVTVKMMQRYTHQLYFFLYASIIFNDKICNLQLI